MVPSKAFDVRIRHLADTRRAEGKIFLSAPRADGTGYVASIHQYPVICAVDFVEVGPSSSLKRGDVVTTDPTRVQCRDCRSRING